MSKQGLNKLDKLRSTKGVQSYVECDERGQPLYALGKDHEELPVITSSLVQLGEKLGKQLGNESLMEISVQGVEMNALFTRVDGLLVGLEYTGSQAIFR